MLKIADPRSDHDPKFDLDVIAREGAQRLLVAALEAEVTDYIDKHQQRDEDGKALVVRNGKALSPAAQDAVRSMLAQLGGQAGNLAALKTGEFHCAVPESKLRKIRGRLCLSHHPSNPPGPEEVKAIAARHRDLLGSE